MSTLRIVPLLAGLTLLGGCDQIMAIISPAADPGALVAPAKGKLQDGDLPGAMASYQEIVMANPDVVEGRIGLAYMQMLAGSYDDADATLSAALETPEISDDVKSEIALRRALVALRKGDLASVQKYGEASGLPAGKVLAAEVYLADAESESAIPLFESAASEGSGQVKKAARTYLDYLQDQETGRAQLAEATALWALGQREEACETASEMLRFLPPDYAERDSLMLLWAGRSVASGRPGVAEGLLDELGSTPEGQSWRVQATRALVAVGNEDYDTARSIFASLGAGGAPVDGLADALGTAAAISSDREFAKEIAGGVESNAVARGLLAAGADGAAKSAASGTFSQYLENK